MRKVKKSFTLSSQVVTFLKAIQVERKAPSESAALDELLLEQERQWRRAQRAISAQKMYDELPDEAVKEDAEWAEFAMTQWPEDSA
jgi:hypothetical protein